MRQRGVPERFRSGILAGFLDVAGFLGIDGHAILRDARIDPRWLEDHAGWLPATSVVRALENGATLSGRDDFGILLADCQSLATLGPVAVVLEHQSTVREILQTVIEFQPTISDALTISVVEEGGTAVVAFDSWTRPDSPQIANFAVATAATVFGAATGGRWRPSTVHFRHDLPVHAETFARFFECALLFNNDFDGFACDSSDLSALVPTADSSLASYARHLLYLTPEMNIGDSFSSRAASAIHLLAKYGAPTLAHVAASLGISRRSVQRGLAKEETSFEEVLNDVRRKVAVRALAHSAKPISQVAYSAGFSSPNAFSRWFRGEFKCSPSDWRRRQHQSVVPEAVTSP